jgi:hypothetical protein
LQLEHDVVGVLRRVRLLLVAARLHRHHDELCVVRVAVRLRRELLRRLHVDAVDVHRDAELCDLQQLPDHLLRQPELSVLLPGMLHLGCRNLRRSGDPVQREHHFDGLQRGVRLLVDLVLELQWYAPAVLRADDSGGMPGEAGRGLHLEWNPADRVRRDRHSVRHDHDSSRMRGAAGLHLAVNRRRVHTQSATGGSSGQGALQAMTRTQPSDGHGHTRRG